MKLVKKKSKKKWSLIKSRILLVWVITADVYENYPLTESG